MADRKDAARSRKSAAEQEKLCQLAQAITALTELIQFHGSRIDKIEATCNELQQKLK